MSSPAISALQADRAVNAPPVPPAGRGRGRPPAASKPEQQPGKPLDAKAAKFLSEAMKDMSTAKTKAQQNTGQEAKIRRRAIRQIRQYYNKFHDRPGIVWPGDIIRNPENYITQAIVDALEDVKLQFSSRFAETGVTMLASKSVRWIETGAATGFIPMELHGLSDAFDRALATPSTADFPNPLVDDLRELAILYEEWFCVGPLPRFAAQIAGLIVTVDAINRGKASMMMVMGQPPAPPKDKAPATSPNIQPPNISPPDMTAEVVQQPQPKPKAKSAKAKASFKGL